MYYFKVIILLCGVLYSSQNFFITELEGRAATPTAPHMARYLQKS